MKLLRNLSNAYLLHYLIISLYYDMYARVKILKIARRYCTVLRNVYDRMKYVFKYTLLNLIKKYWDALKKGFYK